MSAIFLALSCVILILGVRNQIVYRAFSRRIDELWDQAETFKALPPAEQERVVRRTRVECAELKHSYWPAVLAPTKWTYRSFFPEGS